MSADRLREAAKVLRERAEAATPGPWQRHEEWAPVTAGSDSVFHGYYFGKCESCGEEIRDAAEVSISGEDRTYIATMHPGVGLALADWLDLVGAWRDEGLGLMPLGNLADAWLDIERQANVLADLILGSAP